MLPNIIYLVDQINNINALPLRNAALYQPHGGKLFKDAL
jgi:hypothetical protein